MRIDLHTHSTASDGTDSPADLVARAAAAGIDVLAITDHDTTAGWDAAFAACPPSLTVVPGVEFSCVHRPSDDGRRVSLHLLGYFVDATDVALQAEWTRLRENRRNRARRMVDNLAEDYPISWQQVSDLAGSGSVGRPHIGRALVDSGVVADLDAAFQGPLSSRQRYYVRKEDTDVFSGIRLIRAAGGLPIFAHPLAHRRGPVVSDGVIAEMAAAGLVGLEVDHPDHDADDRAHAARLAAELELLPTGSSDYHGHNKTTPLGACLTAPAVYERLLALPAARGPVTAS